MNETTFLGPKNAEGCHNPIIGQTGMGKSMQLKAHCKFDIAHHSGTCYISFREDEAREVAVYASLASGNQALCFGPEKSEVFSHSLEELIHLDLRKAIEEKRQIVVNLSKQKLGYDKAMSIGNDLIKKLAEAIAITQNDSYFRIYLDECWGYEDNTLIDILEHAPEHNVFLTFSFQYFEQVSEKLRLLILNESAKFYLSVFRVSREDAKMLKEKISDKANLEELQSLQIGRSLGFKSTGMIEENMPM